MELNFLKDFFFPTFITISIMVFLIIIIILYDKEHRDETKDEEEDGSGWRLLFQMFAISIVVGAILGFVIGGISYRYEKTQAVREAIESQPIEEREYMSYEITIPRDSKIENDSIENLVRYVYEGSELYYHFHYKTDNGISFKKLRAERNDVFLQEDRGNPRYVIYGEYYSDTSHEFYEEGIIQKTKHVLIIPPNTTKKNP